MISNRFFITGLPRSRTAWMAAWLSEGDTICRHEPSASISSVEQIPTLWSGCAGVSDSGLGVHLGWILEHVRCRVLMIDRDPVAVRRSLERLVPGAEAGPYCAALHEELSRWIGHPLVMTIPFGAMSDMRRMQSAYWWVKPGRAFDEERFRLFDGLNIQAIPQRVLAKYAQRGDNLRSLYLEFYARLGAPHAQAA